MDKKSEHLSLVCDIGQLSNLISNSKDLDTFLQQAVQLVAGHLKASVGSIYLYNEPDNELVLTANIGLNPAAVGHIRMKTDEGLVGYTFSQTRPICVGSASDHPRFKYFESSDEEHYHSFLSVPISLGKEKIGVLVVQHEIKDYFDQTDVMAMRAIASQLASTVANARLMMASPMHATAKPKSIDFETLRFIKAEPAVSGFACAPAAILRPLDPLKSDLPADFFKSGVQDFKKAVAKTIGQLKKLQDQLVYSLPESAALIFEAHHMILKDPRFVDRIVDQINQGVSAPRAIRDVARFFINMFDSHPNPYIQEKKQDIIDLARRLLFNLEKHQSSSQSPLENRIVIASELYPSDILKLSSEKVAGIIFIGGGITSHVTIIARSLNFPMVITNELRLLSVPEGTPVLIDAEIGSIYVQPSDEILSQFEQRNRTRKKVKSKATVMREVTQTLDGQRITLFANINLLSELDLARELKAEGVGLYRSEFPFVIRSTFPSEEEQRVVYARLFKAMEGKPVYVRTLDVGGDKVLPYLNTPRENNPELGLRSIRFSLHYREIFDQQIRAILRAGAHAEQLGIMFPMITSIDEFASARQAVMDAQISLKSDGLAYNPSPAIGAMIETPALLPIMDDLAKRVDFFSIGTNDFIQYMLAVDRTNKNVAAYYQPFHPAILRSLALIINSAKKRHTPVSVCGEVAHQTDFLPFLLGIGVRRLSIDPQFLPEIQREIGKIDIDQAEAEAGQLLQAATFADLHKEKQGKVLA